MICLRDNRNCWVINHFTHSFRHSLGYRAAYTPLTESECHLVYCWCQQASNIISETWKTMMDGFRSMMLATGAVLLREAFPRAAVFEISVFHKTNLCQSPVRHPRKSPCLLVYSIFCICNGSLKLKLHLDPFDTLVGWRQHKWVIY